MNGIFGNQRNLGVFGPQQEPLQFDQSIGQNMSPAASPQAPQRGFMGKFMDFAGSPYAAAMAASLSRGEGLGEAAFSGQQYSMHNKHAEEQKKMQENLARKQAEVAHYERMRNEKNDYYSNTLKAAQANKAMTPEAEKDSFGNIANLRKQYEGGSKDFVKSRDAYARVQASAKDPSAAGDLALIFNYMKVLDPGSVVRESEFATAAASGAFGDRIQAAVGKITKGERLSATQRADFLDRAGMLYEQQQGLHKNRVNEFSRISESFGYDPQQVIIDMSGGLEIPERTYKPEASPAPVADGTIISNPQTGQRMVMKGGTWQPIQ